jgi:DNA-binding response OmpR family regulator
MRKPTLLIVDDSRMVRLVMQRRLTALGYEVHAAEDGYQALEVLEAQPIDLAILDVVMPGMTGLDVVRVIRQSRSRTQLPIIMASSLTDTDNVVGALKLGANDYVTKPVEMPILNVRIEIQLAMRATSPEEDAPPTRDTRVFARSLGPGSLINERYEVLEVIGEGGFARVYKARQVSTDQEVAIKVLRPEVLGEASGRTGEAERFKQEMQLIGRLRHPNIVKLIDCGLLGDGQLFTVLEFVDGRSLKEVLQAEGSLTPNEAMRLMSQVLDALSCAHVRGVVHRDLKPQNIMVDSGAARRHALVLDFGIASLASESEPSPEEDDDLIRGSPPYIAPELLRDGAATVQSDVYAWGLIFLECLTGQAAMQGASVEAIVLRHLDSRPVAIPAEIDPRLREILTKAMAKSCAERYPSVVDVLADLETVQLGAEGDVKLPLPDQHQLPPRLEPRDEEEDLGWLDAGEDAPLGETRPLEPPPGG